MNYRLLLFFCCSSVLALGCRSLVEPVKVFWGSSTKALEEARAEALKKTYQCSQAECMDVVVEMTKVKKPEPTVEKITEIKDKAAVEEVPLNLRLFQQNRKKGLLVVMDVPGAINTTEVGVFFVPQENALTRLEISSLSELAKVNAAQLIFAELDKHFNPVE
jgi:hypothetical protein